MSATPDIPVNDTQVVVRKDFSVLKVMGIVLILGGLIGNHWLIGFILSPDGGLRSLLYKVIIWSFQGTSLGLGLILFFSKAERGKQILKTIGINLLLIVVFILFVELVFGGWFKSENSLKTMNIPYSVRWTFDVSNIYPYTGKTVYTRDKFGLRGTYPDPSKIGILTVGGSTTDNRMISDGDTWQDWLHREFLESGDTLYVVTAEVNGVVNAGVNGHTSYGNIKSFERWFPLIPNLKPKYILFLLGALDFNLSADKVESSDEKITFKDKFMTNSALWHLKRTIGSFFTAEAKTRQKPTTLEWTDQSQLDSVAYDTLMQKNLIAFEKRLLRLIELSRALGGEPIFITQPTPMWKFVNGKVVGSTFPMSYFGTPMNGLDYYYMMRRQDQLIKRVATEHGTYCIDVVPDTSWTADDWYDIASHFTPQGCERFGKIVHSQLHPIIKSREEKLISLDKEPISN